MDAYIIAAAVLLALALCTLAGHAVGYTRGSRDAYRRRRVGRGE